MKYLDLTLASPEENLACDEALLDACEASADEGVLRCYAPPSPCVVVGYGNRVETEVDLQACREAGVPILRRLSGGGTVLLGPGCLAYALVLPLAASPEFATVTGTNLAIMTRLRDALAPLVPPPIQIRGHTDLALEDRKFCGNAQRRRQTHLLFHGALLLDFDLPALARFLRMPSLQPEYRRGRGHLDFVRNLHVGPDAVKQALRRAWAADAPWTSPLEARVAALVRERYGRPEWHRRR